MASNLGAMASDPGRSPSEPEWLRSLASLQAMQHNHSGFTLPGLETVVVERGRAVLRVPVSQGLSGGADNGVHGGALATLLDIALVTAVLSRCVRGDLPRGTVELNISYLRPATGQSVSASAQVVRKGRSLAVVEVQIHNDTGVLVATGRGTYALGRAGG